MNWPHPEPLPVTLARHGFEAPKIDYVINTHLHWDHCSGNTTDEGGRAVATFPNAQYVVQRGELEAAREGHPRVAVSYRPVNFEPLLESGHLRLLDGDTELIPGVHLRVAPGHNRDMMVVEVRNNHQAWCMFADLIPFAAHVTPTWVAAFDLFPLQTIATKTELLRRVAAEGWWCSFGHDPDVAFAKVETDGKKWRAVQTV
jgi:glyoxylase-like metal-dependent hydrolase (beta-lactamase superfamily II)